MNPITRAELLKMSEDNNAKRVEYFVIPVYNNVRKAAAVGKKSYTTQNILPQDIIEDIKDSLQKLFPDSMITFVDSVYYVYADIPTLWNIFLKPKLIERKYLAIHIDWSTQM